MNSINTNFAALTALQSLNETNASMLTTQSRISTGLRIGSASDGAAYWSMATTMRSDNAALSSVTDALGLGAATVDVAYTAMDASIDVMGEIKNKLVAAREPGVDRSKVQTEIDSLQDQLRSIATSASFTGENWIRVDSGDSAYSATETIVASFSRSGTAVTVGTIAVNVATTFLFDANTDGAGGGVGSGSADDNEIGLLGSARLSAADVVANGGVAGAAGLADGDGSIVLASYDGTNEMDISGAAITDVDIDDFIQAADTAISDMTSAATNLGSAKSRIDLQTDFVGKLMDSIERGISSLVDADMNEESTRLQALQVQQQLGIQAMSIANSSSQNILALFR